jgi:hypothetical protein
MGLGIGMDLLGLLSFYGLVWIESKVHHCREGTGRQGIGAANFWQGGFLAIAAATMVGERLIPAPQTTRVGTLDSIKLAVRSMAARIVSGRLPALSKHMTSTLHQWLPICQGKKRRILMQKGQCLPS